MSGADLPENPADLLDQPSMDPPPGVVPDFVNNGGHHAVGYFAVIFCGILSTFALLFRFGSRIALRRFRTEDAFLLIAFVWIE